MRKNRLLLTFLLLSICHLTAIAADKDSKAKSDSIKTGWNFGALPAISFDTDLGFQYGALVNFYDYGDGKRFPSYNHSLYFEVSRFTKGSGVYRFYYYSDQLIKNFDVFCDLSYLPDQANDFYGFNGYDAVLKKSWEETNSSEYKEWGIIPVNEANGGFVPELKAGIISNISNKINPSNFPNNENSFGGWRIRIGGIGIGEDASQIDTLQPGAHPGKKRTPSDQ